MTKTSGGSVRLHNLDYLRGIASFGIMIYHYMTWSIGGFTADTFMARVGVYGVSIFYILSGLTLFHVYFHKLDTLSATRSFFIKRVFRIFPLLWLVTLSAIVLSRELPNLMDLFLNLTGLFGFLKWDTYFSAGIWSIGNELVFYVIFPIIVLCARRAKALLILIGLLLAVPFLYFPFVAMDPTQVLGTQWSLYTNPLNQAFLFFAGFCVGFILKSKNVPQLLAWGAIMFPLALFIIVPAEGSSSSLVTGSNRIIFTALCILICAGVYKTTVSLPSFLHKPLSLLGEASYSVYLIHPLTYQVVKFVVPNSTPIPVLIGCSLVITLALSWACYQFFEKYFMRTGRHVAAKQQLQTKP